MTGLDKICKVINEEIEDENLIIELNNVLMDLEWKVVKQKNGYYASTGFGFQHDRIFIEGTFHLPNSSETCMCDLDHMNRVKMYLNNTEVLDEEKKFVLLDYIINEGYGPMVD